MSFSNHLPYDRAERRVADNALNNAVHDGGAWDVDTEDDVAIATYPDPKARKLYGETSILKDKREQYERAQEVNPTSPPVSKPVTRRAKG